MKTKEIINKIFMNTEIIKYEDQNKEYEGIIFTDNNGLKYRSRLAKKTNKKAGYFVVLWQKDKNNLNTPYNVEDNINYYLIVILDDDNKGYFLFPKQVLSEKEILTNQEKLGKMAFRIYPNWCINLNNTALKTQKWQLDFFNKI